MTLILVVDDDPDISRLVEFKLSHAGMDVVTKTDGETGLAAAEQLLPELVLLDWIMPKLTGIEVCQRLRANSRTARIPVVLLTAKAQQADVQRGSAAGADDYIIKPFSPRELLTRVEALLVRCNRAGA
jgi:DNA-binding response OmpR family regulator